MVKSEDIFEIPLTNNKGFYLGRIISDEKIYNIAGIPNKVLLEIYDCFSCEPFSKDDINNIVSYEELMPPLSLAGIPKLRGPRKWKRLGNISLKERPFQLPDFYVTHGSEGIVKTWKSDKFLDVKYNSDVNSYHKTTYPQIYHLQIWQTFSSYAVRVLITMYHFKKNNIDIDGNYQYSTKKSEKRFEETAKGIVLHTMPNYSNVPKKHRWKEIPLNEINPLVDPNKDPWSY